MDTTTTLDRIAAGWFVHPGSVVLDIGANRGESAAVYLDHGAARVIAFEPRDAAREAMAASLVTDERFTVLPYAMCQRNGTVVIRAPRRNPAAASISRAFFEWTRRDDSDDGNPETVECRRLDDLDLPRADFWKIDVEGAELETLRGAAQTLAERRPDAIQVEMYRRPDNRDRYLETLNLLASAFPNLWAAGKSPEGRLSIWPVTAKTVSNQRFHQHLMNSGTPRYFATVRPAVEYVQAKPSKAIADR